MSGILNRLMSNDSASQRCPDCDEPIGSEAVNIKEGMALCPGCGKLSRLSELNHSGRSRSEILAKPPSGCSILSDGHSVTLTASLRSLPTFVFTAAFALFWNGITSVFVFVAMAGLYTNLIGPLPNWFPAPAMNDGRPEMNGEPMGLGATLFLCVFLIPFVTIGLAMAATALLNLLGKTTVVIDEFDSYVATGVGFLRWKTRFDLREIRFVEYGDTRWQSDSEHNRLIELKGNRTVRFGSWLPFDRLEWLRTALQEALRPRGGSRSA